MDQITKPALTRLARRAGVKSLSEDCFDTIRNLTSLKLTEIIQGILTVNNEHSTKTIMSSDTYEALRLLGYHLGQSTHISTD